MGGFFAGTGYFAASASPGINARVSLELGVAQPCNNESGWMIPRKIYTRGCNKMYDLTSCIETQCSLI